MSGRRSEAAVPLALSWRVARVTCWILAVLALGWLAAALATAWQLLPVVIGVVHHSAGEFAPLWLLGGTPFLIASLGPVILAPRRVRLARALARREPEVRERCRALGGVTLFPNVLIFLAAAWEVIFESGDTRFQAVGLALLASVGLTNGVLLLKIGSPAASAAGRD